MVAAAEEEALLPQVGSHVALERRLLGGVFVEPAAHRPVSLVNRSKDIRNVRERRRRRCETEAESRMSVSAAVAAAAAAAAAF